MRSRGKLKTLNHLYHNRYDGHQTYQGGNIPQDVPSIKLYDPLITWFFEVMCELNVLYFCLQNTYGHQTRQCVDLQREALTFKVLST